MKFVVVIPARLASARLPGKVLLEISGKPMLQHVYERALQSGADDIVIATDSTEVETIAKAFGARVCMTDPSHPSGTDRLAEVVDLMQWPEDTLLVNVQGDEPLLPPALVQQVATLLHDNPRASMSTLCERIVVPERLHDPNIVKVVFNAQQQALYFSRQAIPAVRSLELAGDISHYRHIGLYAYRAGFLKQYVAWPRSPLEIAESLEQLRVLWHGHHIQIAPACTPSQPGVDTAEDLAYVRAQLV